MRLQPFERSSHALPSLEKLHWSFSSAKPNVRESRRSTGVLGVCHGRPGESRAASRGVWGQCSCSLAADALLVPAALCRAALTPWTLRHRKVLALVATSPANRCIPPWFGPGMQRPAPHPIPLTPTTRHDLASMRGVGGQYTRWRGRDNWGDVQCFQSTAASVPSPLRGEGQGEGCSLSVCDL